MGLVFWTSPHRAGLGNETSLLEVKRNSVGQILSIVSSRTKECFVAAFHYYDCDKFCSGGGLNGLSSSWKESFRFIPCKSLIIYIHGFY